MKADKYALFPQIWSRYLPPKWSRGWKCSKCVKGRRRQDSRSRKLKLSVKLASSINFCQKSFSAGRNCIALWTCFHFFFFSKNGYLCCIRSGKYVGRRNPFQFYQFNCNLPTAITRSYKKIEMTILNLDMEDVLLAKKSPNGHKLAHFAMPEVRSLRLKEGIS